ncbi:putative protein isoform X2 [Capsicum annuum]|uniref:uncharacterized protein LOC107877957 isoform X2 n=1 Tax=Capsicum annuum TaxID=4072 RepID=UPI0007BEB5F4|nr:uncharacterized protein LOC107877957 isoform X2 [Capsicum annuum]
MLHATLPCPFRGVHIHLKPTPLFHLLLKSPMAENNPQRPVYTTSSPAIAAPPQSWLEVALTGHALTFTMQCGQTGDSSDDTKSKGLSSDHSEGMKLGLETYGQYHWFAIPPTVPNPLQASASNIEPPVVNNLLLPNLPFYPQPPTEAEVVPWIQQYMISALVDPTQEHLHVPPMHQERVAQDMQGMPGETLDSESSSTFMGQMPPPKNG